MILQLLNYWRGNNTTSHTDSHQGEGCSIPPVRDVQNGEAEGMKTRHCKAQEVRMPEKYIFLCIGSSVPLLKINLGLVLLT